MIFPQLLEYPRFVYQPLGVTISRGIDAMNEYFGVTLKAPKTGQVSKLAFYLQNSSLIGTLTADINSTNGNGLPGGTVLGSGTLTNPPAGFNVISFSSPISVTRGSTYNVRVRITALTSGLCAFRYHSNTINHNGPFTYPTLTYDNGGGDIKSSDGMIMMLEYSDGSYPSIPGLFGGITESNFIIDNTTYNQLGVKIVLPFSAKVVGMRMYNSNANGFTGSTPEGIYFRDSADNLIGHFSSRTADVSATGISTLMALNPIPLQANTTYYWYYFTNGAPSREVRGVNYGSAAAKGVDTIASWNRIQRLTSGPWTEAPDQILPWSLLIEEMVTGGLIRGGLDR